MNDDQKLAYLMGMSKFAQDNNVDATKFMKVAFLGRGYRAVRGAVADAAGATRGARDVGSDQGFMAGAKNLGRRFTDTVGDAFGTRASRTRGRRQARVQGGDGRFRYHQPAAGGVAGRQFASKADAVDNNAANLTSIARRNLAVGAGAGAAGLYGLGVANNAQQAARGAGKYDISQIPLWDRIMMFLGMKDQPNIATSILNPFSRGFRQ